MGVTNYQKYDSPRKKLKNPSAQVTETQRIVGEREQQERAAQRVNLIDQTTDHLRAIRLLLTRGGLFGNENAEPDVPNRRNRRTATPRERERDSTEASIMGTPAATDPQFKKLLKGMRDEAQKNDREIAVRKLAEDKYYAAVDDMRGPVRETKELAADDLNFLIACVRSADAGVAKKRLNRDEYQWLYDYFYVCGLLTLLLVVCGGFVYWLGYMGFKTPFVPIDFLGALMLIV